MFFIISIFLLYPCCDILLMQGASQLPIWYSKHSFFGNCLQILILNIFLKRPIVKNLELPFTKGPKISPLGPINSPFLFLLVTNSLGNFSSVIFKYVYLC